MVQSWRSRIACRASKISQVLSNHGQGGWETEPTRTLLVTKSTHHTEHHVWWVSRQRAHRSRSRQNDVVESSPISAQQDGHLTRDRTPETMVHCTCTEGSHPRTSIPGIRSDCAQAGSMRWTTQRAGISVTTRKF